MTDEHEIFAALEKGEQTKVISLLEHDPSLANIVNEYGQTPFWLASSFGYTDIVKIMLQMEEVDYRVRDHRGRDALDAAEAFHNKDIIEILNPVFGVGVYSEPTEKEESFFELVIPSTKNFFQNLNIAFIFAVASFVLMLFVSVFLYDYSSPNSHRVKIVTTESNNIDIERTVLKALYNQSRVSARMNIPNVELDEEIESEWNNLRKKIKSEGWSDIQVNYRNEEITNKGIRVGICSVELKNSEETHKREIAVTYKIDAEPFVWSDVQLLPLKYKSTRISLIQYMIKYCWL